MYTLQVSCHVASVNFYKETIMANNNKTSLATKWTAQKLTISALLIAVGMLIPLISPLRWVVEPASFTLASHVAIFIAMMLDPAIAVVVAIGTSIGFFVSFPLVIALRALSHIVFALLGSLYLKKFPDTLKSMIKVHIFSVIIALIHAICEVAVVFSFYFGGSLANYSSVKMIVLIIGLGTVIHSIVDFEIAYWIYTPLSKQNIFSKIKG